MNNNEEITILKKKSIKISNILKDISKDIEILSKDLTKFPEKKVEDKPNNVVAAGHVTPVINNAHVYFTNSLRRFW
tara:strand:+ start:991 stop:1218 length:228 start_codon:yes stop_codon:yes gene_type:complete